MGGGHDKQYIIVTDPPFNIGYHYATYNDRMGERAYMDMLKGIFTGLPFVVVHYPEEICKIAIATGQTPTKIVSWVYNSNTAKQHRDIAFFGVTPDFRLVTQPYKNPNDARIKKLIASGKTGGRLYDWWNVNQVKNVSKSNAAHPCIMPQEVVNNIIGILPNKEKIVVVDPFMGSGTTGIACKKYGVDFIGIEIDGGYYDLACKRIADYTGG